jgi:phage shock protein A
MSLVSLIGRVWNVLSGKANALVDKIESPEDQLRSFVNKLNGEMTQVRESVVLAMTEEKKLKANIQQYLLKSQEWEKKAIFALDQGQEDLAREALVRKGECDESAIQLKAEWEKQSVSVERLKVTLRDTQTKAEAAKREYTILLARYKSAQAKQNLNRQLSGINQSSTASNIEGLNERILKLEAQTDAELELGGGSSDHDLEARFAAIDQKMKGDDALQLLKQRMSSTPQLVIENKKKVGNG